MPWSASRAPRGKRTVAAETSEVEEIGLALDEVVATLAERAPDGDPLEVATRSLSALVIPLRAHLADAGALVALYDQRPAQHVEERDFLAAFADQAALALDRAQAVTDREKLAVISDRERIARDLHDVVIQRLFATGLQLRGIAMRAGEGPLEEPLDQGCHRPRPHDQGHPRHDLRAPGASRRVAPSRDPGTRA